MNDLYNLNSLAILPLIWTEILKLFILNLIGRSFASIIFGGEGGDGERENCLTAACFFGRRGGGLLQHHQIWG